MGFLKSALTASLLLAGTSSAVSPVQKKGEKLFTEDGKQFYIKGIAYQQEAGGGPGGSDSKSKKYVDPLADEKVCKRDVPLLEKLGVNTIRTYAIDPEADHSACMKMLDDAGIYVIADLGEPALSINRDSPAWNVELFDRYKGVMENLAKYDNTIGFFAGNEVTNNNTNTGASAFVKAAVRDTKKWIADNQKNNGGRWMGVGYAANDDAEIRINMAQFFNCGEEDSAIDFWGYNIYSWCGKSSFEESGYDAQVKFFSNYSVPVFFAEYGCNSEGAEGRLWDETTALYSDKMTDVFSGGIVYMFHQEANDYGVVKVQGDNATPMKNYKVLQSKLADVKPSSTSMDSYNPTNSAAACPAISKSWKVAESLPPTPDEDLCDCMFKASSCVPSDELEEKEFGDIFGYICANDEKACAVIKQDTEKGVYGPYSMCNPKQQLGAVLNAYYQNQNSASNACDFNGAAKTQSGEKESSCEAKLEQASKAAEVAATATAGSSSTATGDSSESSGNAAAPGGAHMAPFMTMGDMAIGLYMIVAMATGAGMILL